MEAKVEELSVVKCFYSPIEASRHNQSRMEGRRRRRRRRRRREGGLQKGIPMTRPTNPPTNHPVHFPGAVQETPPLNVYENPGTPSTSTSPADSPAPLRSLLPSCS
ncbi:hypothetical protein E2C01_069660 [Portunus trituberculatus]|uniref:Uncharacterized protein n=1 Tax=Portunus trituberculatus TaxID=210409 RepID=A0A5B7HZH3_PORTR|nr:hypothetical protein [Portunus trituberculatus]